MEAPTIVADVFPATVRTPSGAVYDSARVLVTSDYLWLFVRAGAMPRFVQSVTLVGFDPDTARRSTWDATDDTGGAWQVTAGGGCGCGDPLRRYTADGLLALVP